MGQYRSTHLYSCLAFRSQLSRGVYVCVFVPIVVRFSWTSVFGVHTLLHRCDSSDLRLCTTNCPFISCFIQTPPLTDSALGTDPVSAHRTLVSSANPQFRDLMILQFHGQ